MSDQMDRTVWCKDNECCTHKELIKGVESRNKSAIAELSRRLDSMYKATHVKGELIRCKHTRPSDYDKLVEHNATLLNRADSLAKEVVRHKYTIGHLRGQLLDIEKNVRAAIEGSQ